MTPMKEYVDQLPDFREFCQSLHRAATEWNVYTDNQLYRSRETRWFIRREGICINYDMWMVDRCHGHSTRKEARSTLTRYFSALGMHPKYPFNRGSSEVYDVEADDRRTWENPERIAFVVAHANMEMQP